MKKFAKLLGVAALATLTLVACKNQPAEEPVDTMMEAIDTTVESEAIDTTVVAEVVEQPAAKKVAKKAEEPQKAVNAKAATKDVKPNAKDVASDLKEVENNGSKEVKAEDQKLGKKSAREAFKKN